MAKIHSVTITLCTPAEKRRFPFIPGFREHNTVEISKTFTSPGEMLRDLTPVLDQLVEIWEDDAGD